MKMTYNPWMFNKLNKVFKPYNITLVPTNKFSVKNLIHSNTKDKIPVENKQGVYQIDCKDCDKIYIEQTKRNLKTRIKEHFRNIKYKQSEKSAVATHHLINGNELNLVPKLLKNLTGRSEMTMQENLLILKNKERVMNFEIPPCDVFTKKFVIKPTEGVQMTTTHPTGVNSSREMVENGGTPPLKYVLYYTHK